MANSFSTIKSDLFSGKTSCVIQVDKALENIEKHKELNAFLEVYKEEAKAKAAEVDSKIKAGNAGKLAGMIVGLKDVIVYKNHKSQASSKILDGFESQFNATVVERLLSEDAIIIGRQNCDEFAMGSTNENSSLGNVKNMLGTNKVPGGSSGGSAVAVQAEMCHVSLGSDTGGSVRQPASFTGTIGLKPTYSRISRFGLMAYASSFDCIGIIGNTVEDVALTLEIIAGKDSNDSTVSQKEVLSYSNNLSLESKKLKIGYFKDAFESEGVDQIIKDKTQAKIDQLTKEGHQLEAVEFPLIDYFLPTYYILTTAEASSNLSRYDGVRYGYRSENTSDLESMYKKTRQEGFGEEVKRRIMLGTFVLSASYYDAFYTKAQKIRRLIKDRTDKLLEEYDFIILPAAPSTAFEIGKFAHDPLAMYMADIFTVQANLVGIPAISIPNGSDDEGMPIGLQVLSSSFSEDRLLAFSQYLLNL